MPLKPIAIMAAVPLLLAACAPPPAAPPAPPAEARSLTEPGAHDQRLDDVTQELRDALEPAHGRLEVAAYRLPAGAAWPEVEGHYRAGLPGWRLEPSVPENIRAAHARAWRSGRSAFAVALIDTPVAGQTSDYAILVTARAR